MSNTNIRPWKQGPEMPAEFSARVNQLTNWQRSQWMRADQPGAVDGSVERLDEFLAALPARFEQHTFALHTFGNKRVPMEQILQGRTGITVRVLGTGTALVDATERMINRLLERFHYCLGTVSAEGE